MRVKLAEVERRMVQVGQAWDKSCPEQTFAEKALAEFRQEAQACLDAKAKLAAAAAEWDVARRERDLLYAKMMELILCIVSSVKGNPKFGENSALYAAMGYVPKSERSSGLTRRREAAAPKAPAKPAKPESEDTGS